MLSTLPYRCPDHLLARARQGKRLRVAIVGADNEVALESARLATEAGLIEPLLVGDPARLAATAERLGWDIAAFEALAAEDEASAAALAVTLASQGRAEALMKGHVHTDTLLRAVLRRDGGLRTGRRLSHLFYMTLPDREGALTITDAAVNVAPSIETRLDIARNAIALHHALGQEQPRLAVLSATEVPNDAMPSSREAEEIVALARAGELAGALIEGPLALDLAISPQAVAIKGHRGEVAGRADIVLVPNIETGNALFKAMVYLLSATAAGLVMGAQVPIILTSRADPPEARLASTALAVIAAGGP